MTAQQDLILKRLREEGQKTAAYFGSLAEADWDSPVYTTGPRWRVRDVLAHLLSAEQTFHHYGQQILAGGPGAPEGFVIDDYNAAQVAAMGAPTPGDLVSRLEAARAATVALVAGMAESDFAREGRHPWFGLAPLGQMLKLVYRHAMLHERDVRRALELGGPVPHVDVSPPTAG
jgi:uncharacterized protein (TIGR03083 family)